MGGSIDLNRLGLVPTSSASSIASRIDAEGESETPDSIDISSEVRDTIEIEKLIGFQMDGCEKDVRKAISKSGDVDVDQLTLCQLSQGVLLLS